MPAHAHCLWGSLPELFRGLLVLFIKFKPQICKLCVPVFFTYFPGHYLVVLKIIIGYMCMQINVYAFS